MFNISQERQIQEMESQLHSLLAGSSKARACENRQFAHHEPQIDVKPQLSKQSALGGKNTDTNIVQSKKAPREAESTVDGPSNSPETKQKSTRGGNRSKLPEALKQGGTSKSPNRCAGAATDSPKKLTPSGRLYESAMEKKKQTSERSALTIYMRAWICSWRLILSYGSYNSILSIEPCNACHLRAMRLFHGTSCPCVFNDSPLSYRLSALRKQQNKRLMAECSFKPRLVAQLPWDTPKSMQQSELCPGLRMYTAAMEARRLRQEHLLEVAQVLRTCIPFLKNQAAHRSPGPPVNLPAFQGLSQRR